MDEEAPRANAEETLDRMEQRTSRSSFTRSRDNLSLSLRDSGSSVDVEQSSRALSIAAKQVHGFFIISVLFMLLLGIYINCSCKILWVNSPRNDSEMTLNIV